MSLQDCFKSIWEGNRCVWHLGVGEAGCWKYISALGGKESTLSSKFEASKIPNIYTKATRWTLSRFQILKSLQRRVCEKSLFISRESFWVSEKERWVFDFFFFLKTRVIFLGLCKKRSPRNNHVMDFQFISIRRHIYEGFASWIELEENFRLKPRENLQHKYDNSVTLWLWLCWKPPRLQLKSKPWYDLPEKVNANQKATKNISGYFSTVSVFACKRIFIKTAGWSFVVYRLSDEPEPTETTNAILVFFFFFWTSCLAGQVLWGSGGSEIGVNHSFEDDCLALFFFFITERESSERRNTSSRLKQKFSDNLNWTCLRTLYIQR